MWGDKWIIRGDFNDIRNNAEKQEGKLRQESSFRDFKNFISTIGMGEVNFIGESYAWANNREGEGLNRRD